MSSDVIQKIKDAADIVELVSDFVPLKRSGASYIGLCPFHNDGKPSMHVSPSKGIFKCFSCGAGGDIFKFWSEYHKKDFKETIKDLAQRYGIQLSYTPEEVERNKQQNIKIKMHELAAQYYMDKLFGANEAKHCRDYLEQRKISTESIQKFKLGYAPYDKQDSQKLIKLLKEKLEVNEEQIVEAGLAIKKNYGQTAQSQDVQKSIYDGHTNTSQEDSSKIRFYDRFRGRLMIPIFNEAGKVIAFGARALKDPRSGEEAQPKYLNSPETDIYHKGNHLYGMNFAKEFIRKEDSVTVVEGYFDVISAHQAGIYNIVANQGTALTPRQAKLLIKFSESKRIYLCFDSDQAGEQATERGTEVIMQVSEGLGAEIRIIRVDNGKDLDELIKNGGASVFHNLIQKAPLIIDYQIEKILKKTDLNSPRSKAQAVNEFAKILSNVSNQVEFSEYIKLFANKSQISEMDLKNEVNKTIRNLKNQNPYSNLQRPSAREQTNNKPELPYNSKRVHGHIIYTENPIPSIEREILLMSICKKESLEEFLFADKKFINENPQKILDALTDITFENPEIDDPQIKFQLLSDKLSSEPELSQNLADIGMGIEEENLKTETAKFRLKDAISRLDQESLKEQMKEVINKIKEIEKSNNPANEDLWLQLQREKQEIVKLLQK